MQIGLQLVGKGWLPTIAGKRLSMMKMVAEVRSGQSSRTETNDIIDLGTWQEALVSAIQSYKSETSHSTPITAPTAASDNT